MLRKIALTILITFLLIPFLITKSAFGASPAAEYLCELGVSFYRLGRYDDALLEFRKALMLEPQNKIAKDYVNKIFTQPEPAPTAKQYPKRLSREERISKVLDEFSAPGKTKFKEKIEREPEEKEEFANIKITGETQVALGISSEDIIWKQANADLNEKNWRTLDVKGYNRRANTFDTRTYDRLRVNVDTKNSEGLNFHSDITVDPWSFTGKSEKRTITSAWGDSAEVELKYWSNTGYTINESVYTNRSGNSFSLPEIKVNGENTHSLTVSGAMTNEWGLSDTFSIPALKIQREFQPLRELWLDYSQPESFKIRFFPIAYQDQALTSDDPLRLSNNHIWWEESPWLDRWRPGNLNNGASPNDFSKGEWDDSLSYFTRDSDGVRLTALRGFSFSFEPQETTSLATTFASPKGLWQDYNSFDNFCSATRIKHSVTDNFSLGSIYTFRMGLNEEKEDKKDITNHMIGLDAGYEITKGLKISTELAQSVTEADLSSPGYATKSRGNAYYFSLVGVLPRKNIMDLEYGYDGITPDKGEDFFAKTRLFFAHMDEGFNPALSTYRETRDDAFWSRHINFRKPFAYYYSGLYYPSLKWEDVQPFRIGNGVDIGRDVVGFRLESSHWDKKADNLLDIRNVHNTDGKFIENVSRDEVTYKVNEKLTAKLLGIYQRLPKTKGGIDPFIFDSDTGEYLLDVSGDPIDDGKNPSLKTGSLGLEYAFYDWLSINGIWECSNDYSLAYDNYPRGNLNNTTFSTYSEYDKVYRKEISRVYSQSLFPQPPYPFYDIFKAGLRLNPLENLEIYLDYTRNEFKSAGQIDDNINHIGLELSYLPVKKLGLYLRYTYSRWNDLTLMTQGYSKYYLGHHNFFSELRYFPGKDDEFVMQFGDAGRSPIATVSFDPFGTSIPTLDTQHILRLFYRRKF